MVNSSRSLLRFLFIEDGGRIFIYLRGEYFRCLEPEVFLNFMDGWSLHTLV